MAGDGSLVYKGDGGLATSASLYTPYGVAVDASGIIYIADTFHHRIRLVNPKASTASLAPSSSPLSLVLSAPPTTSLSFRPSSLPSGKTPSS